MRFVTQLSEDSQATLQEMKNYHPNSRVRTRAHVVLLSADGFTRKEISRICKIQRDTVSRILTKWETIGLVGLLDKPRSGRPRILTPEEELLALEYISEDPRNSKKAQIQLQQKTGKEMSQWTFKRTLKRSGLKWKRMRRSVKHKQDIEKVNDGEKKLNY